MNWKSEIIHFDPASRSFFGRTIEEIDPVCAVTLPASARPPSVADRFIYRGPAEHTAKVQFGNLGEVHSSFVFNTRSYHFQDRSGKFLSFDGQTYEFSRETAGLWESFLLLTEAELSRIRFVLSNRWVVSRDGYCVPQQDVRLDHQFSLALGRLSLDLRFQDFELMSDYEFAGCLDGWKLEKFYLYRPLIYITAFSDVSVLNQLRLCVRSLIDVGRFDGTIVVMTDQGREKIYELCHAVEPSKIKVAPAFPTDFAGFVCAKYSIYEFEEFVGYQPIVYLDPDIISDRPIEEMLAQVARAERICAPLEGWNQLRNHPPIGATLLQLDNLEPRFASGLNGGTITLPNVANQAARERFELIRRTVANVGDRFGRGFNKWADQEVANYVAFKFGGFDTTTLTRYLQWQDGRRPVKGNRLGLVHFWGHSADEKVARMELYLSELQEAGLASAC